jgi:ribosome-binding ATPase
MSYTKEEEEILSQWPFLTMKKVIYVANVKETDLKSLDTNKYLQKVKEFAKKENSTVIPICAKLEQEIASLDDKEAKEFLKEVGLKESGLNQLIKAAFKLLNLITFITTGEIETKAWTIQKGTTAKKAAGKIHTDLENGFIRAEVVTFDDYVKYKSRANARDNGKARSEGKDYIVEDGDVVLFYHS